MWETCVFNLRVIISTWDCVSFLDSRTRESLIRFGNIRAGIVFIRGNYFERGVFMLGWRECVCEEGRVKDGNG